MTESASDGSAIAFRSSRDPVVLCVVGSCGILGLVVDAVSVRTDGLVMCLLRCSSYRLSVSGDSVTAD